ncbi:MAG: Fe-S cluster assembly protein SufD, partial [Pseudomonadota bacterium]
MATPELKPDATAARLLSIAKPDAAAWSRPARDAAVSRVEQMQLPERRDEYWKYTRPDTLVQPDAPHAALFHNDEGPLFDDMDRLKIVFVDGVFDADA